jgi:hypothetical protein
MYENLDYQLTFLSNELSPLNCNVALKPMVGKQVQDGKDDQ